MDWQMRYSGGMDKRKKILFLITQSSWGGAQRYVYDIAGHLPPERFDIAIAAGGNGLLFDRLADAGIRTIKVRALQRDISLFKEFTTVAELVRLFVAERPDIVHLNSSKIGGLGALAAKIAAMRIHKKIRVAFTVHGWGFYEDRSLVARTTIFLVSFVSSLFQDAVITINTADFRAARRFIAARKLHLIFNGLDAEDFLPADAARDFLTQKIAQSIAPDTLLIGTIAELTKNKGLSHLIDAISKLMLQTRDIRNPTTPLIRANKGLTEQTYQACIIGDGEEKEAIQKQIDALGLDATVFLTGFIPDAEKYLAGFDIFVLPSLKEGLPYAAMEAMAAGVPVIATRVGGLPDLITSGKDGLLVSPKNPAILANALAMLSRDPDMRARLGAAAREKIETTFNFHAMIDATINIYASL